NERSQTPTTRENTRNQQYKTGDRRAKHLSYPKFLGTLFCCERRQSEKPKAGNANCHYRKNASQFADHSDSRKLDLKFRICESVPHRMLGIDTLEYTLHLFYSIGKVSCFL